MKNIEIVEKVRVNSQQMDDKHNASSNVEDTIEGKKDVKQETPSAQKDSKIVEAPVNYFNCPLCIYIVDKKITLREHLSINHYKTILLEMFSDNNVKCKICKKTYSNENH